MLSRNFTTARLMVRFAPRLLADPARRREVEIAMRHVLTPAVLQHLPPPLQLDEAARIGEWLTARMDEAALFVVSTKNREEPIGLLLLAQSSGDAHPVQELHVGYLFAETAWGRGYASELLAGLVASLPGDPPVMLVAGVGRDNPASARVLEKAGFVRDADRSGEDTDTFVRAVP